MTLRIEKWTLGELARHLGGELTDPAIAERRPTAVGTDTRAIEAGSLFVALRGENFDAHDFVGDAIVGGACTAIVSRVCGDAPQIVVPDTLRALQALGALVFQDAKAAGVRSIALTGSNGKTTTKELIAAVWGVDGAVVHATRGNLNNHIGVPLTLCATPVDATAIVIEMGANQFGDIAELVRMAPADVRVITSIGYAHIEGLGSLEGVRRVKSEIFGASGDALLAVVPETERMQLWLNEFAGPVATVGSETEGGVVRYKLRNGAVEVRGPQFEYRLQFKLPGAHNQHNLAVALATLLVGEWRPTQAGLQAALDATSLPGGRWRRVRRGRWIVLDDAYNANPSSVRASWDAFVEIAPGPDWVTDAEVVAVIGEMFELGDDSEELHRQTAAWVARRGGASAFVFVGQHGQAMAEAAALETSADVEAFDDPEAAGRWVALRPPGVVYLKASRGQALERLIDFLPE